MIARCCIILMIVMCFSESISAQTISKDMLLSPEEANFRIRLVPGDVISVKIRKVPQNSGFYLIDENGMADMQLIGKVKAAGITPIEFQKVLMEIYGRDYLQDPFILVAKENAFPDGDVLPAEENLILKEFDEYKESSEITLSDDAVELTPTMEANIPNEEPVLEPEIFNEFQSDNALPEFQDTLQEKVESANIDGNLISDAYFLSNSTSELKNTNWTFENDSRAFLQFLKNDEIAGFNGCNNFYADYLSEGSSIDIKFLAMTVNECVDIKDSEFQGALESVTSFQYSQEGNLELMSRDNEVMLSMTRGFNKSE